MFGEQVILTMRYFGELNAKCRILFINPSLPLHPDIPALIAGDEIIFDLRCRVTVEKNAVTFIARDHVARNREIASPQFHAGLGVVFDDRVRDVPG